MTVQAKDNYGGVSNTRGYTVYSSVYVPPPPPPPPPPKPVEPAPKPVPKNTQKRDIQIAQRKLSEQQFYPPEAIARNIEGEVRLIIKLAENGAVDDVAIAASSGHAILDNAAIRAAYAMGALTGVTSRELILPVVFRLE